MKLLTQIFRLAASFRFDLKRRRFILREASTDDKEMLISFKFDTIFESNKEKPINNKEKKKLITYVKKSTTEHLKDYKVIMIDRNIAGSLLIYPHKDGIILDELYLKKEYRFQGIGTKIINDLIKNNQKIYLWVYKTNDQALSIYQKLNFKIIDETDTRYKMIHE